ITVLPDTTLFRSIAACVRSSARGPLLIKPLKNAVNNSPNSNTQSHSATANGQARMQRHSGSLQAIGLSKYYGRRQVVKDVSMKVNSGEVVGLLGPNGAGKTTSFYMIVGIVSADAGRIEIDDTPITTLPIHKRSRMGLSYLPQDASVFRRLNVESNIRAVLELQTDEHGRRFKKPQIQEQL